MEQNINENNELAKKPSRSAIGLLIVVVVLIGILFVTSKTGKMSSPTTATAPQDEQTVCYYSSTATASGFNDIYSLQLTVNAESATGELATAPAEKDRMKGVLSGVIMSSDDEVLFTGAYANTAEDMQTIEQKMIKLSAEQALIGYGEMKVSIDGSSYEYVNPNAIDYSLAIPRVDCAEYKTAF